MKMVKSLLLGSAAGLVAIASAQAADLPVKAKPVQYVKICSLYGAGFYYIPGTDICLKIGGFVRAEYIWGTNGSTVATNIGNYNYRLTNNQVWRSRGYITADARNQTAYGTVRSYIAVGLNTTTTGGDNAANQFDANRAFIQWAGFTFGRATSFFDFYSFAAPAYIVNYSGSDTGDSGWNVAAYTAQFGGGFSATISAENRRMTQIANSVVGGAAAGTFSTTGSTVTGFGSYGGWQSPDIVANLRIDQAWGSAQLMGALHEVNASYYGTGAGSALTGNPGDKWGYAVGAGIKLNAPMIGAGDYFQAQVNYTEGALRYLFVVNGSGNYYTQRGGSAAFGVISDGVYGSTAGANTSGIELTKAWNFNASYEHFWNQSWKTSLYGGYAAVRYSGTANAILCFMEGGAAFATNGGASSVATAGCNNNWSTYWVGSRTQWSVTKDFYMGLDILYTRLQSATTPTGMVGAGTVPAAFTGASTLVGDQNNWTARFRVHRDFMP